MNRFDFAMVLDDSGSMRSGVSGPKKKTRWDELKEVAHIAGVGQADQDEDPTANIVFPPSHHSIGVRSSVWRVSVL